MPWALWLSRTVAFLLIFVAGVGIGQIAPPLWKTALIAAAQPTYAELTYSCDRAMREHLLAKLNVAEAPGSGTVGTLKAAELGLLDCQDYDMLRKQLLLWGLTENELSLMMLNSIETEASTLQQVVEAHEIRF